MAAVRYLPAGDAALLVELQTLEDVLACFARLRADPLMGVTDLVPAARTLLVMFQPGKVSAGQVRQWLAQHTRGVAGPAELPAAAAAGVNAGAKASGRTALPADMVAAGMCLDISVSSACHPRVQSAAGVCVDIPVDYNGEDLDEVAERLDFSRAELVERHTGTVFQAAFAGFAPGFVYLSGGDPCFHGLPRRPSPRTRVPAGGVAAAGDFSAIYPSVSPGGWQLLGVTPLRMWDLNRARPALLQPGDQVRFRDLHASSVHISLGSLSTAETSAEATAALSKKQNLSAVEHNDAGVGADRPSAGLEVLRAGVQTLLQDAGRPGLTSMGVSASGALDRTAMRRANRLVGNPDDLAVLENVLGGLQLRCHGQAVVAVTGAQAPVTVVSPSGMRLPAAAQHPLRLENGQILRIGPVRAGMRCYVAARGGWDVAPVLGSLATDVLAGIGPASLQSGDCLGVGKAHTGPADWLGASTGTAADSLPRPDDVLMLDVIPGPRDDWFEPIALERLFTQEWRVTPQSNRVGMRLRGAQPLPRSRQGELPSEGAVAGAIQVPADGQPVLFLADHPLTGGYPVIAVVRQGQLDLLGQIPVGVRLRFQIWEKADHR